MRSVLKLVSANIRHKKGAFTGIIFLMMLTVFSFTGTVSNNDDLNKAIDERFSESEVGDILVRMYSDLFDDDIRTDLENNEHISDTVYKERVMISQRPKINGEEKDIMIELSAYEKDIHVFNDDFSAFLGPDTSPGKGEIYLPYKMKTLIDKGSEIEFSDSKGTEYTFTVMGFYEDPVFGAMTVSSNYGVISPDDHKKILSVCDHVTDRTRRILSCTDINIHISDNTSPYELKKQLNEKCNLIDLSLYSPTKEDLMDNLKIFTNVGVRMVGVYILMLTVIILIIMGNSISSSIEMDYTDLGILKSQGFSQTQIRLAFVIQYTLALLIGTVIGLIISFPGCGALIRLFMNLTGMLTKTDISVGKCILLSVIIIIICAVFVYAATDKIGRISPVRAISGGRDDVYFDSRLSVPVKKKLLSLTLAVRQLTSNRKNYAGTAVMTALLIFFMITITAFVSGFDSDAVFTGITGDIQLISRGDLTLSDKKALEDKIHSYDSAAFLSMECRKRMNIEGQQVTICTYSREEDYYTPTKGRAPKYDNEIMITKNVSRSTGREIGDTLNISYLDTTEEFVVTGYFQTVSEYGIMAMTTSEGMEKLGYEDIYDSYITLSDVTSQDEVISSLNDSFGDILEADTVKENETLTKYKKVIDILMDTIAYVIYSISVVFAAVMVGMVTRSAFLRERTDLGIYKSMGITSGKLMLQFALRFTVVSVIGSLIGILLSVLFTKPMLGMMLEAAGLTDFAVKTDIGIILIPSVLVCAGVFICSFFSSAGIKTVEVRELITE